MKKTRQLSLRVSDETYQHILATAESESRRNGREVKLSTIGREYLEFAVDAQRKQSTHGVPA